MKPRAVKKTLEKRCSEFYAKMGQLRDAMAAGDAARFYRLIRKMHGRGCACPNCTERTREAYFAKEPYGCLAYLFGLGPWERELQESAR